MRTHARVAVTDGDGIRDGSGDPDGDGLTNREEFRCGTDPLRGDPDGDGVPDSQERLRCGDGDGPGSDDGPRCDAAA